MAAISSRRAFLRTAALAASASVLAACQPKVVEKIVERTVVVKEAVKETVVVKEAVEVQKEVTRVVEKVVEQKEAPKKEVTLRFHARIGEQENKLYGMQMPKFMEANPNIKVVLENFPSAEYSAKVSTMHAGGTIGDVIWSALGQAKVQFHYSQGIIRPIDELVAAIKFDLSQYYPGCLKGITVDGKLLGLPFKSHPGHAIYYYNENLLKEAGLEAPKATWTQDDMVNMAKAVRKIAGSRPVFGVQPQTTWKGLVNLMRSFGHELISADGKKFQLGEEKGIAAVTWLYDLFQTHKVAPTPEQLIGSTDAMWSSGNLGFYQAGTSVSVLRSTIGDKFKWMAVNNPIGPGGVGGSDFEVDCDSITVQSKNPTEAFEWVKYLTSQDSGVLLGVIGGTVGGRPDVYGSPVLLSDPVRPVFRDIMEKAQDSRIVANWRQEECEVAQPQLMQPLWVGKEKPTKTFIDTVVKAIQDIMDKPKP